MNQENAPRGPRADAAASAPGKGPVLPWMRVPITIQAGTGVPIKDVLGLDCRLASELLQGSRFHELFPVQAAVWQHSGGGLSTAHDLCVAAPTGSGKTLAYALPVVNALAALNGGSKLHVLRALVVLPTRDLAAQVFDVFRPLCEAVGLRDALAAARSSEAAEAAALVGPSAQSGSLGGGGGGGGACSSSGRGASGGGWGGADVVVATPGRLMAHLAGTPGFSLRHLRFLVVDETDRLLRQSYQEWLPGVLAHLPGHNQQGQQAAASSAGPGLGAAACEEHFAARWPGASVGILLPCAQQRVVKIIVSATLTRDPAKLQRLAMHNPRYVATVANNASGGAAAAAAAAGGAARYSLPRSLSEYRLLCSAARKPLALLALLSEAAGQSTIVFTSSLEMTHKLYLMLRAVPELPDRVVEYSSLVPTKERAASLERFKSGEAKVLVASDAMTRGMDVDCVQNVINYDAPVYAKTYVHRAGRTARAGKPGRVITLLRDEDMRHFKTMIRKADNNYVRELKLPPERVEGFRPALAGALAQLEELLAAERAADASAAQAADRERRQQGPAQGRQQEGKKGPDGEQQEGRRQKLGDGADKQRSGEERQRGGAGGARRGGVACDGVGGHRGVVGPVPESGTGAERGCGEERAERGDERKRKAMEADGEGKGPEEQVSDGKGAAPVGLAGVQVQGYKQKQARFALRQPPDEGDKIQKRHRKL